MLYFFRKASLTMIIVAAVSCLVCSAGQAQWAKKEVQAAPSEQAVVESAKVSEPVKKPEPPRKKTAAEIAAEKAAQAASAKKAEAIKAGKEKMNNTSWVITLTESTDKPQKETIKDTLRFTEGSKVESEKMVSEGFAPSNITVRIKREDKLIWETMQSGKEGELAFWRGDIKRDPKDGALGDTMTGVLSWHKNDKDKTVKDYSFVSEGRKVIKSGELRKEAKPAEAVKAESRKQAAPVSQE